MAKRSLRQRETQVEEKENEDEEKEGDVIEEVIVEEMEARNKRVCAKNDGERKEETATAAAAVTDHEQQQQQMRCQADNCEADLGAAKKYHQRHKVCENHAKAAVVSVAGVDQRYCQQCSRFHELSHFDDAKRSCRERLAHHNERRRKVPPDQQTEDPNKIPVVLRVKDSPPGRSHSLKPRSHNEVIKIALPRNPTKHFQIK